MNSTQTTEPLKYCQWCEEKKPLTAFRSGSSKRDGCKGTCKKCEAEKRVHKRLGTDMGKPETHDRLCVRCETRKPVTEFTKRYSAKSAKSVCKECHREYQKSWKLARASTVEKSEKRCYRCKETLPISSFQIDRWSVDGHLGFCRKCLAFEHKRKTYGITRQEYETIFNAQSGLCAICMMPSMELLHVDHDHATGKVRGLLCNSCNTGIGHLRDDVAILKSAITYIEKHKGVYA